MSSPIYFTQLRPPLVAGVWMIWHQNGFPLEQSWLVARGNGWAVDWMEAMIDASRTDNCPALMEQIEMFLDADTLTALKVRFVAMVRTGKTFDQLYAEKRAAGRIWEALGRAVSEAST